MRVDKQAELKKRLDELRRQRVLVGPKEALVEAYRKAGDLQAEIEDDLER